MKTKIKVPINSKKQPHIKPVVNTKTSLSTNKWIKILTAGLLIIAFFAFIVQLLQYILPPRQECRELKSRTRCHKSCQSFYSIPTDEHKTKTLNDSNLTKLKDTAALKQNTVNKKKKPKQ